MASRYFMVITVLASENVFYELLSDFEEIMIFHKLL